MKRLTTTMERWMLFFGQRYPINFSYYIKLKGSVSKDELAKALQDIRTKHALPFTRLIDEEGGLKALTTDGVGEPEIIELPRGENDWIAQLKSIINEPFHNDKGPFLRIGLRNIDRGTELFFIFQHSVADGVGAVLFIQDLFKALAGDFSWQGEVILPDLYHDVKEEILKDLESRPREDNDSDEPLGEKAEFKTLYPDFRIVPYSMNQEELKAFRNHGKENGLTVHSLLGAILLKSSAEVYGADSSFTRKIQCPVDFRAYLKEEVLDHLGVFNGIIKADIDCDLKRSYLEIGREIQDKLKEERKDYKDLDRYWNFKKFGTEPYEERYMETIKEGRAPDFDFSFSNVGRLDWEDSYGDLKVEEVFGPTFSAVNGELVIGLNSSFGKMNITLIYDPAAYDDEKGQLFAQIIDRNLKDFLGEIL